MKIGMPVRAPSFGSDHPSLPIGSPAPSFSLPGTDGKTYTLASFSKSRCAGLFIFTCKSLSDCSGIRGSDHPTDKGYSPKNVAFIAIMPNDPASITLDELGYTDMGDITYWRDETTGQRKKNSISPISLMVRMKKIFTCLWSPYRHSPCIYFR